MVDFDGEDHRNRVGCYPSPCGPVYVVIQLSAALVVAQPSR